MKLPICRPVPAVTLRACFAGTVVLALVLLCTGCGDYFRPVAFPVVPVQPNPGFTHVAVVISQNGTNNPGASTTIDVSGDSNVSQATVGLMPVHAALVASGTRVYVANRLDNTISEFGPTTPTPVTTISLPAGSAPAFVNTAESSNVYIANAGSNTVSSISVTTNVVTNTVQVGVNPVSIAETPNAFKLYVANAGNSTSVGSVSSINPVDLTVNAPVVASLTAPWVSPVWAVARNDSQRVYILDNGSGFVSAINTANDTVVGAASVGVGGDYMIYDSVLNRVYVTNPAKGTLTSLDVSTDSLTATTVVVPNAVSVAALGDGTRVYVSSSAVSGSTVTSQVTVVRTADFSIKTTVPLGSAPVSTACLEGTWSDSSIAASADYSRVYVGNCDAGNIAIIQTSDDTLALNLAAPLSAQPPEKQGGSPPPQNPVFVVAGP
ncbi:MAG TPA: YncE family protein [Terriglobales bacterium]|nr:YncE family protein [Terriglobales bacterium]